MSKSKKLLINITIILLLCFIFLSSNNFSITPTKAFDKFEIKLHYGPSKIVHQTSHSGNKYIIAKYDQWFSMTSIERALLLFWSSSSSSIGNEIDKSEAVNIQLMFNQRNEEIVFQYFGVVNDKSIKRIELKQNSGDTIEISQFFDDMFIYVDTFNTKGQSNVYFEYLDYKLTAFDINNNIVYESEYSQY